jgi:hypothetical protein
MKGAAQTTFSPEEVRIITQAYVLALKNTGRISKVRRDFLAREILILAKSGCWETDGLAAGAIRRVYFEQRSPSFAAVG